MPNDPKFKVAAADFGHWRLSGYGRKVPVCYAGAA